MKGNEAVVGGAILGGATHFFGYPITPASEVAHAAALYFPRAGGTFLQAESEVNAINMIYGAAAAGVRTMTATSGPGVSLMTEGISYISSAELPCVIVDVQRAGPGLGNIWPEQGDYHLVTKGAGHGDFRSIVLAPASAQEMCDFTYRAFELADAHRIVVFILSDAYIGQMMEPVELPTAVKRPAPKPWALHADPASRQNLITSIYMSQKTQGEHCRRLAEKARRIEREFVEFEEFMTEDAEVVFVAFGIAARVCYSAVQNIRKAGHKAGLLRPKTLWPFPAERLAQLGESAKKMAVVELNSGQMAEDVERAVRCRVPVLRFNWMGGEVPSARGLIERVRGEGLFT